MIECYEPGTHVTLCNYPNFNGMIISIDIQPLGHVRYQIEWWSASNDRHLEYFDAQFVISCENIKDSTLKIGFVG